VYYEVVTYQRSVSCIFQVCDFPFKLLTESPSLNRRAYWKSNVEVHGHYHVAELYSVASSACVSQQTASKLEH